MSKVRWADMTDDDWPDPPPVAVSKHGIKVAPRPPTPAYVPPHLRSSDKTKTRVDCNDE